jgi:hypothetical protein
VADDGSLLMNLRTFEQIVLRIGVERKDGNRRCNEWCMSHSKVYG